MFAVLPDLTPRDSHTLWYSSSRGPLPQTAPDPSTASLDPTSPTATRRQAQAALERTPLARLRADEIYQERRRHNISNFGATWLKPPGIAKSLHQLREERREAEEHAEAMRREQIAQQLAEAEAGDAAGVMMDLDEDGAGGGEEGEGERDLDDEIPDADAEGFGLDGAGSDEDSEEDEEEDDEDVGEDAAGIVGAQPGGAARAAQRRELLQMRADEDRVRDMMTRGQNEMLRDMYGPEEDLDAEDQAQLLEEEDLVPGGHRDGQIPPAALELDEDEMQGDLDDDIPEASDMGYEHTDSDAEISSDEEDDLQMSAPGPSFSSAARQPNAAQYRTSLGRAGNRNSRNSLDISGLLSGNSSSIIGSSPQMRRRP